MAFIGDRIKEYHFNSTSNAAFVISADGNMASQYTLHPINGEILKVVTQTRSAGSILLQVSGTVESLLILKNVSGTNPNVYYPVVTVAGSAGAVVALGASGNMLAPPVVSDTLMVTGSGFTSGTTAEITYFKIYYR